MRALAPLQLLACLMRAGLSGFSYLVENGARYQLSYILHHCQKPGWLRISKAEILTFSFTNPVSLTLLRMVQDISYPTLANSVVNHADRHDFANKYLKYLRKANNFNKKGARKKRRKRWCSQVAISLLVIITNYELSITNYCDGRQSLLKEHYKAEPCNE